MFRGAIEGLRKNAAEQSLHDRVVERLAEQKRTRKVETYANPGTEKNLDVDGLYPDVVVFDELSAAPKLILLELWEVETVESVTDAEASQQWRPYSEVAKKYGAGFCLLVPLESVADAVRLCALHDVDCNIWSFKESLTRLKLERHTE